MKYIALLFIPVIIIFSSCKEAVSNDANNRLMEDTLFKSYATVNRVTVEVKDNEEVAVLLGDKELFNASEAERQKVADEIAMVTVHIYKEGNWLKKGTVTFVADESHIDVKNEEKKVYDMHLDALLK
jgi:hypothetical protein